MDSSSSLLLVTLFVPLIGAIMTAASSAASLPRDIPRWMALVVTGTTLILAAALIQAYPAGGAADQSFAATEVAWLPASTGTSIHFSVGLDGLAVWLFGLTALLCFTCVLVSWEAIADRPSLFFAMLLLLEFGCLGVFVARDVILFYVFFEFTLIPLFFLIGIWGGEDRQYAANKFFLYTLAGSVVTFLGLLAIVLWAGPHGDPKAYSFLISDLTKHLAENPLPIDYQRWIFLALFAGFAIKVPLFPLHTWLPLAHVQAPSAGSVLLAGVLLKIGTYGFLRFNLPFLPDATAEFAPWLLWLSVAGIIYGALVALAQSDIKRLIAYSSVSHLGFCMLGLFALNPLGLQGAVLQMVNHGISTGGLFAIVGMIYERYHTREISQLGGLATRTPLLAVFLLIFTFSSIGLPGMNGFAGEFLILIGMFQRGWSDAPASLAWQLQCISVLAVSGVVLGAWYMLWLVQRTFFGPLKEPHAEGHHDHPIEDMSWREVAALAPLCVFVFWIGLAPGYFLERISPALNVANRATEVFNQTAASAPAAQPLVIHQPNSASAATEAKRDAQP